MGCYDTVLLSMGSMILCYSAEGVTIMSCLVFAIVSRKTVEKNQTRKKKKKKRKKRLRLNSVDSTREYIAGRIGHGGGLGLSMDILGSLVLSIFPLGGIFAVVFELVIRGKEIRKRKATLSRFGLTFVRVTAFVLFVLCVLSGGVTQDNCNTMASGPPPSHCCCVYIYRLTSFWRTVE